MARRVRDSCLFPFHYVVQAAFVAGSNNITANPAGLSPRALTEADTWTHFRLVSLKYRLLPPTVAPAAVQAVSFVGGIQDTSPGSLANVFELLPTAVLGSRQTSPTQWVRVSKSELSGALPWYKTIQGTADSTEEAPGQICVAGTTIEAFALEIAGVFEFKGAVATANTPAAVALREDIRQLRVARADQAARERLVAVLATRVQDVPRRGLTSV